MRAFEFFRLLDKIILKRTLEIRFFIDISWTPNIGELNSLIDITNSDHNGP